MASDITLSAGVRQNLLSLQTTAELMSQTQNRLATGKKVNSALDNPTNFFTSASLHSRAGDMSALLDNMTTGIKTLEAADNGLTSITKTIESMQSTLRQARQDKSFKSETFDPLNITGTYTGTEQLTVTGGAFGELVSQSVDLTKNTAAVATDSGDDTGLTAASTLADIGLADGDTFSVSDGTETHTYTVTTAATETVQDLIDAINAETGLDVTASLNADGAFTLTADNNEVAIDVGGTGTIAGIADQAVPTAVHTAKTVDELVSEINRHWLDSPTNSVENPFYGKVRASNDSGKLRIENISTQAMDVSGALGTGEIGGNQVRANLVKQFNELRDQLDKIADDASYSGINLLRGDLLKMTFNETGTSTIEIQARDLEGQERPINTGTLGITFAVEPDFDSDETIDLKLNALTDALGVIRSQASSFGSNLSIVENRTEFTKAMINTLQTGADALVLADTNEEGANMLALQTRQQLSSTALSLASQADQAVLRLF